MILAQNVVNSITIWTWNTELCQQSHWHPEAIVKLNFLPQEASWLTLSEGTLSKTQGQVIWTDSKVNGNYIKKITPSCQEHLPFHLVLSFPITGFSCWVYMLAFCIFLFLLAHVQNFQTLSYTQSFAWITFLDEFGSMPVKLKKYIFPWNSDEMDKDFLKIIV